MTPVDRPAGVVSGSHQLAGSSTPTTKPTDMSTSDSTDPHEHAYATPKRHELRSVEITTPRGRRIITYQTLPEPRPDGSSSLMQFVVRDDSGEITHWSPDVWPLLQSYATSVADWVSIGETLRDLSENSSVHANADRETSARYARWREAYMRGFARASEPWALAVDDARAATDSYPDADTVA